MYKVGDIVKIKSTNQTVIDKFSGKSYEVFQLPTTNVEDDILLGLRNVNNKEEWENYYRFPLELDMDYYRRKKLKKICSKLEI